MRDIDLTDDPTSTPNPGVDVIDIHPVDVGMTERDVREMWLGQYELKCYFAARNAVRLALATARDCPDCGAAPSSVDPRGPLRYCGECRHVYHRDGTVVSDADV